MTYQRKSNWHWLKRLLLLFLSIKIASNIWQYDIGLSLVVFVWSYAILWLAANGIIFYLDEKIKNKFGKLN
jgi:hypothetical protein